MKTGLTEREKIAVSFAALQTLQGLKPNWTLLYIISRDKAVISTSPSLAAAATANRWKNSAIVTDFFREQSADLETWILSREQSAIREHVITSGNDIAAAGATAGVTAGGAVAPKNGATSGEVQNYAERGAMLQELNKLANCARDSREKLDALKIIADLQRFKDTATSEKPEIKRFYMPLKCQNCELYKRAKQRFSES